MLQQVDHHLGDVLAGELPGVVPLAPPTEIGGDRAGHHDADADVVEPHFLHHRFGERDERGGPEPQQSGLPGEPNAPVLRAGLADLAKALRMEIKFRLTDPKARIKLYQEMQVMEHDAQPDDKIAHSVVYEVMRKEVSGYKQSPFGSHEFQGVDLK